MIRICCLSFFSSSKHCSRFYSLVYFLNAKTSTYTFQFDLCMRVCVFTMSGIYNLRPFDMSAAANRLRTIHLVNSCVKEFQSENFMCTRQGWVRVYACVETLHSSFIKENAENGKEGMKEGREKKKSGLFNNFTFAFPFVFRTLLVYTANINNFKHTPEYSLPFMLLRNI